MPHDAPLFLRLLTAHLLGDYLFQSSRVAQEKYRPWMLAGHIAVHAALLAVLIAGVQPRSPSLWFALLLTLVAHGAIDWHTSRRMPRNLDLLALDQSLHIASLVAAVAIARPQELVAARAVAVAWLTDGRAYVLVGGFVATVWVGAVVVGRLVEPFAGMLPLPSGAARPGLLQAGRLIGYFERTLVFVAVLLHIEALVGLIVAAKAILRLPEAREPGSRELAEYYLVGSLASVTWAVVIVVLVRWAVQGRP